VRVRPLTPFSLEPPMTVENWWGPVQHEGSFSELSLWTGAFRGILSGTRLNCKLLTVTLESAGKLNAQQLFTQRKGLFSSRWLNSTMRTSLNKAAFPSPPNRQHLMLWFHVQLHATRCNNCRLSDTLERLQLLQRVACNNCTWNYALSNDDCLHAG